MHQTLIEATTVSYTAALSAAAAAGIPVGAFGWVREEAILTFPKIRVPPNHPILIGYPILIGFSFINHPFWGFSPYFRKPPYIYSIPTVNFSPADSWMTSLALLTEMATEKMTQAGQEKKHGNRKEK